jgi:hypothetical protein
VQRQPATSIRASVKPEALTCLDCGVQLKLLKRHLTAEHHLSPDEYRARWRLPRNYPMIAPAYAKTRAEAAMKSWLGRKPGQRPAKTNSIGAANRANVEGSMEVWCFVGANGLWALSGNVAGEGLPADRGPGYFERRPHWTGSRKTSDMPVH